MVVPEDTKSTSDGFATLPFDTRSEKDAATLIRTVVSVVAHCHNLGVMHRDLKPENFLLESKADNAGLKCTDFGLSVFFKEGQAFSEVCLPNKSCA